MCFFGLVPALAHLYPCMHSYVFLRVPNGLSGQWHVILGFFKLFWAVAVRHCGQAGRARLSFLLSEQRLGWGCSGQGGGKPWDVRRKQPKDSLGAVVVRGVGKTPVTVQHGRELGGTVLERLPGPLGTLPRRQGLWDQLHQTSNRGCSLAGSSSHPANKGLWGCGESPCRAAQGFGVVFQTLPLPQPEDQRGM